MKGIILAGGSGTRLYPSTKIVCKQLLPVYDKPLIYYSLSHLMLMGITEILIISTPKDLPRIKDLLFDGSHLGLCIAYQPQMQPRGIAESFLLAKEFIGQDSVCLILGDNIFFGHGLIPMITQHMDALDGAVVFGYNVDDPQRYGVVEFDDQGRVLSIEEKPQHPKSHFAVTGLYLYDNSVVEIAQGLTPSHRGELEITDVNNQYLQRKKLKVQLLGRGHAWLDTGTCDSFLDAANYVATMERRQGLKIGCPEEVAYRKGFITKAQFHDLIKDVKNSAYGQYLRKVEQES